MTSNEIGLKVQYSLWHARQNFGVYIFLKVHENSCKIRCGSTLAGWMFSITIIILYSSGFLAPENEFPEIIYAFFGLRQNIFSPIYVTEIVVICAAKVLKIG